MNGHLRTAQFFEIAGVAHVINMKVCQDDRFDICWFTFKNILNICYYFCAVFGHSRIDKCEVVPNNNKTITIYTIDLVNSRYYLHNPSTPFFCICSRQRSNVCQFIADTNNFGLC